MKGSYFICKQQFEVKNVLMMDLFLTNSQPFLLINDGLELCGSLMTFLSVVWTPILTANIQRRGSIGVKTGQWRVDPNAVIFI